MKAAIGLAAVTIVLALCPAASAAGADTLDLVPEWPASFDEARREPIRLLPGPPLEERSSHAALEPGSRTAGTSHTFHWELQNPDGSPGPAGPLPLASDEPVVLDVYLSAGPPSPRPVADVPAGAEAGLAPQLTLEAALTIAGASHEPQQATHTIVNPPGEDQVERYRMTFDVETERLDAGDGLEVELAVHQARVGEEALTQPLWRIHTGAQHPTGLHLELDPPEADDGEALSLQNHADDLSPQTIRQGAYAALAASLLAAGWAARRGYRELREE